MTHSAIDRISQIEGDFIRANSTLESIADLLAMTGDYESLRDGTIQNSAFACMEEARRVKKAFYELMELYRSTAIKENLQSSE